MTHPYDTHHYRGHTIYALTGPGPYKIGELEFSAPLDLEINLTSGLFWCGSRWYTTLADAFRDIDIELDDLDSIELDNDLDEVAMVSLDENTPDLTLWPEPEPGPMEPVGYTAQKSELRRCWDVTWAMFVMPFKVWTSPAGSDWRWVFRDLWDGIRGLGMILFLLVVSIVASLTSPISGPAAFFILRRQYRKERELAEKRRKAMDADI